MATLDTIKDILQENLDIAPENVDEDSTFESLGVDSLDMVELICELEERLDVDFGEPEGLVTMGDLVEYVDILYFHATLRRRPSSLGWVFRFCVRNMVGVRRLTYVIQRRCYENVRYFFEGIARC